ncbi:MAG TPA: GTPase ObgE [Acidimicrobiia bacterium]|nr:GTPase ObgE [Acidimicrobiia bacterium]
MARSGFVDEVQVNLRGGDGGAGAVSFRREAHVPRGGPDGGDGGAGGDVILAADRNTASLLAFRDHPHRRADSGRHGAGRRRHGARGADLTVSVPEGTLVRARDGDLLADLVATGDRYVAARGGRGGRGNARFLSNRRRAPGFAEQGEYGEERWLRLEVSLVADAALVGLPNAGKSTLIAAVSAARPKIADYPFTTLEPHLGVVREDGIEFVLADIPGLIDGAADGRGLGHRFLRHVERARVLVLLLDLANVEGRSPADQERTLLAELQRYQPELCDRPRLAVGTKADVATAPYDGLTVSAVTHDGLDRFVRAVGGLVAEARAATPPPAAPVVLRPADDGFAVVRDADGAWRVAGRGAERVVAVTDLNDTDAQAYVRDRFRRLGVDRALFRAGARDGDLIRIGAVELEYVEESTGP